MFEEKYNPAWIEQQAQQRWTTSSAFNVSEDLTKPKYYCLSMLPYPSGKLHMGHVRNYTIGDVISRQKRMQGFNVLQPMGWDAFGLPAENAAIANKIAPAQWTYQNIDYMRGQLQRLGLAIDWSREVATCDPSYYRWNQWLFLKMLEKGIAYRKTGVVNWDPVDNTVLANEQVIDGRGWRTGALVEKREIPMYYLAITRYAEALRNELNALNEWPERVRLMQENWIGKSEGVRFCFTHQIHDEHGQLIQDGKAYVFTTRADTIMGVSFCAVAAEHPLAIHAAKSNPALAKFLLECQQGGTTEAEMATKEKLGMFTGLYLEHPLTKAQVPLWVGNYVLMTYGDGAVMGVPAHDERDFAFALKYQLLITQVCLPPANNAQATFSVSQWQDWYAAYDHGGCINSGVLNGLNRPQATDKVASLLAEQNFGKKMTTWRLRDWGISRQRYWGCPIPLIHCADCGTVPVPEKDLPVLLPEDCIPDGSGNPLKNHPTFLHTTCPQCGKAATRETDTMDTFVDSSWYFMRYTCPDATTMTDERTNYWMPVDQYIGGIEHAILHLLYARFWTKVMHDMNLVNAVEPFQRLLTQGMVLNHIYSRRTEKGGKQYFWPHDIEHSFDDTGRISHATLKHSVGDLPSGTRIDYEGIGTMSKSKNNGVDPNALIEQYGADTARLYTMFTAPPDATLEWNDTAVEGSARFLRRLWAYAFKHHSLLQLAASKINHTNHTNLSDLSQAGKKLRREIHLILRQVSFDYERQQYNTVVSGCMKTLNALENFNVSDASSAGDIAAAYEGVSLLLSMLHPVCPHITDALWVLLGYQKHLGHLHEAAWPVADEQALIEEQLTLVLQINGKVRGELVCARDANEESIRLLAQQHETVVRYREGKALKKVIVVPKRLVNVVIADE